MRADGQRFGSNANKLTPHNNAAATASAIRSPIWLPFQNLNVPRLEEYLTGLLTLKIHDLKPSSTNGKFLMHLSFTEKSNQAYDKMFQINIYDLLQRRYYKTKFLV